MRGYSDRGFLHSRRLQRMLCQTLFKLPFRSVATSPQILMQESNNREFQLSNMSSRRSISTSKISQDELNDLVLKLQTLLPQLSRRQEASRVSASEVLEETCSYIKSLQREVDDLSEKLSKLLDSMDIIGVDLETIGSILQQ